MSARTRAFFRSHLFSVLSALISIVALAAAVVAFWVSLTRTQTIVDHNQRMSDHRFCGILNAMIAAPSQQPTSPYGQAINAAARSLAKDLGCGHG